jgi:two-component system NtrC family sensor kinase
VFNLIRDSLRPRLLITMKAIKWLVLFLLFSLIFTLTFVLHQHYEMELWVSLTAGFSAALFFSFLAYLISSSKPNSNPGAAKARKGVFDFRGLFDSSPDLQIITTLGGEILEINQSGLLMLGVGNKESLLGKSWPESTFMNPTDWDLLLKMLKEKDRIRDFEIIYNSKTEGSRIGLLNGSIQEREGVDPYFSGVLKDISERVNQMNEVWQANMELLKANEQIKKAQEKLLEKEKMASVGVLAAGVAHEINNPLGFLKSNFSTLKDYVATFKNMEKAFFERIPEKAAMEVILKEFDWEYLINDAETLLEESQSGFDRILEIVKSLKSFVHEDKKEDFLPADINTVVKEAITLSKNEWKYHADLDFLHQEISPIPMHQGEISQVVLNFIVNAAHAIKEKGLQENGRILVKTYDEGPTVAVSIKDNGVGISQEIKKKIFEPFFTTKPVGIGSGLGLSISYEIIKKKHHGKLSVKSKVGIGSEFIIHLPKEQEA